MADPTDDLISQEANRQQTQQAGNLLLGVQGVPPEAGMSALVSGPKVGVPPDAAVFDPTPTAQAATMADDHAALQSSPPLAGYVAAKGPAVAATARRDMPGLGDIANGISAWVASGGPIGDIARAAGSAWQQAQVDEQRYQASVTSGNKLGQLQTAGSAIKDYLGVLGSPWAAITSPVAHGLAFLPDSQDQGGLFRAVDPSQGYASYQDKVNRWEGRVGIALSLVGKAPGEAPPVDAGTLRDVTPPKPYDSPPALLTDQRQIEGGTPEFQNKQWNTSEDGALADASGAPVKFTNEAVAQSWVENLGNQGNHGQIFEVAPGEDGGFNVVQKGQIAPPVDDVPPLGAHGGVDAIRASVATTDADRIGALQEQIAASPLTKESPTFMQDFLGTIASHEIGVDGEAALALYDQHGFDLVSADLSAMTEAARNGQDWNLPLGKYLAMTSGQPFAQEMNKHATFREDGVSQAMAKDMPGSGMDVLPGNTAIPEPTLKPDFTPTSGEAQTIRTMAAQVTGQIQRVAQAQYLSPLFSEAKALGMTKTQMGAYSDKIEAAVQATSDKMMDRIYNQIKRERTPEWKASLIQNTVEAEQELAVRPDIAARSYLVNGKSPLGAPIENGFKLAGQDDISLYGKDLNLPKTMFRKNGVTPDEAAMTFGFNSGAEMLWQISDLEQERNEFGFKTNDAHFKALAKALGEDKTRAELGYDLDPDSMYQAASESFNGPQLEDVLVDELKQLAKDAGLPFQPATIKQYAKDRFEQLTVKRAVNLKAFEKAIYRGGTEAERALLKGDFLKAFQRKQVQYINHVQLAEAHKFSKILAVNEKRWRRWAKKDTITNLPQEYTNYIHAQLSVSGFNVKRDPTELLNNIQARGFGSLPEFIQAKNNQFGSQIEILELGQGDPQSWTVSTFRDTANVLQELVVAGRLEQEAVVAKAKVELAQIAERVAQNADSVGRRPEFSPERLITEPYKGQAGGLKNLVTNTAKLQRSYIAEQLWRETGLKWADGSDDGVLYRSVELPLKQGDYALQTYKDMIAGELKKLRDSLSTPNYFKGLSVAVESPASLYFQGEPLITLRAQLPLLLTKIGTEENLNKLLKGYGWKYEDLHQFLDSLITPDDLKVAQGILNIHKKLWPDIEKLGMETRGVAPTRRPDLAHEFSVGKLEGGYSVIEYEKILQGKIPNLGADPAQPSADSLMGANYTSAMPNSNYTKSVTGYKGPITLDATRLLGNLEDVIFDLSYRKPITQAWKILNLSEVRRALQDTIGPEVEGNIHDSIKQLARKNGSNTVANQVVANAISKLRRNIVFADIAFNLHTAIIHPLTALVHSMGEVGAVPFAQGIVQLLSTFGNNPEEMAGTIDFVTRNSKEIFFNNRATDIDTTRNVMKEIMYNKDHSLNVLSEKYGSFMLIKMAQLSAYPQWMARYNMAMAEYPDHDRAVTLADASIRATHGSSVSSDVPSLLRLDGTVQKELVKTLFSFMSFFNSIMQRHWVSGMRIERARRTMLGSGGGGSPPINPGQGPADPLGMDPETQIADDMGKVLNWLIWFIGGGAVASMVTDKIFHPEDKLGQMLTAGFGHTVGGSFLGLGQLLSIAERGKDSPSMLAGAGLAWFHTASNVKFLAETAMGMKPTHTTPLGRKVPDKLTPNALTEFAMVLNTLGQKVPLPLAKAAQFQLKPNKPKLTLYQTGLGYVTGHVPGGKK